MVPSGFRDATPFSGLAAIVTDSISALWSTKSFSSRGIVTGELEDVSTRSSAATVTLSKKHNNAEFRHQPGSYKMMYRGYRYYCIARRIPSLGV